MGTKKARSLLNSALTRLFILVALVLVPFLAGCSNQAIAGEGETRTFAVTVDKEPAGEYQMTIQDKDGSVTMTCNAKIKVTKYMVYTYKYTYQGTEVWKDNQLQQFSSTCDDDGKKYAVTAKRKGKALALRMGSKESEASASAWLTTYWHLPDAKLRAGKLTLIDADTGKLLAAKLEKMGSEKIKAGSSNIVCNHYRLTGDVKVDLWYDSQDRLIREEFDEDGHHTVLSMTKMTNK
jgi:hypothetical protein